MTCDAFPAPNIKKCLRGIGIVRSLAGARTPVGRVGIIGGTVSKLEVAVQTAQSSEMKHWRTYARFSRPAPHRAGASRQEGGEADRRSKERS